MKVPEKLQTLIKQLFHFGDISEIQARSGFSRYRISKVVNGEDDSDPEVVQAVADFYETRKETLSDYITD